VAEKSVDTEIQRHVQSENLSGSTKPQDVSLTLCLGSVNASLAHSILLYLQSTYKMAELSLEDKCKAAAKLIEQSPPGEVK